MSNPLRYRVYRAALDSAHQFVLVDGKIWKCVSEITSGSAAFFDGATVEFTDRDVVVGTRYLWRIVSVDSAGNESLALAQPGIQLRRHLGAATLSGKILVGYQPDGGNVSWIYTLDPAAAATPGQYSARWTALDQTHIPELEQLYELLVADNTDPALPVAAALAHGGVHSSDTSTDVVDFAVNWRSWRSRFGQNYPESRYGASQPWHMTIALASPAPADGATLTLLGQTFTFGSAGGPGKIRLYTDSPVVQLELIALALSSSGLPLSAWVDGDQVVLTSAQAPQASSTGGLTLGTATSVSGKSAEGGVVDTDLTPHGEGSGGGFYRKWTDVATGHIHLRVDWNEAGDGARFARGAIMVGSRLIAEYLPGGAGVVDYVFTAAAADGVTPTAIEIRKYHPAGHYVAASVVKIAPKRTAVRLSDRVRLRSELGLTFDPWKSKLRLALDATLWQGAASFVTHQLYQPAGGGAALPRDDYFSPELQPDLAAFTLPLTQLAQTVMLPLDIPLLTEFDLDDSLAPVTLLRSALFDDWGLSSGGLWTGGIPGNSSLWSVPAAPPLLSRFVWQVEATGTETYLEDGELKTRPWKSLDSGGMNGWRQYPQDESQRVQLYLGGPTRRPSQQSLSVKVESLLCRDRGDSPLLRDGESAVPTTRPEVLTYLPSCAEQLVDYRTERQAILTQGQSAQYSLTAGSYRLRASGSGKTYRLALTINNQTLLVLDSYLSAAADYTFDLPEDTTIDLVAYGDADGSVSLSLMEAYSRRVLVARPSLPYLINDFTNWPDADDPAGRSLSAAPREWPDADSPSDSPLQWHSSDWADQVAGGVLSLSPGRLEPDRDGYELTLIAHAIRDEIGGSVEASQVAAGTPVVLRLPPLIPLARQSFDLAGWGRGDSRAVPTTFQTRDPRISASGSCSGVSCATWLQSPPLRLRSGRIVVGSPRSDFTLYWFDGSSWLTLPPLVPVCLGLSREKQNELWATDYRLPLAEMQRLAISFPDDNGAVYGVWLEDEAPYWKVKVLKDGEPYASLTGSADWTDLNMIAPGLPLQTSTLHSVVLQHDVPGTYSFQFVAYSYNSLYAQTSGNDLLFEAVDVPGATETNSGAQLNLEVEIV